MTRQADFQDPQLPPKHLARAVSKEKRPKNGGEKGRPGGAASLRSNGGSSALSIYQLYLKCPARGITLRPPP